VSRRVQPWCKRLYQQCCWTRRRPSLVRPKRLDYYSADTTSVRGEQLASFGDWLKGADRAPNLGNRAQTNVCGTEYGARNEGEKLYETAIPRSKKSWQVQQQLRASKTQAASSNCKQIPRLYGS
jgi:hypothetical protein